MIYKVICLNGYSFVEQEAGTFNSHNKAMEFMEAARLRDELLALETRLKNIGK